MPVYEYLCKLCNKKSSFLLLRITEKIEPYCKICGNKDVKKCVSKISVLKGEEKIMENILDPSHFSDIDESNPVSIERTVKRIGKNLGEEFGGNFEKSMEEVMSDNSTLEEGL